MADQSKSASGASEPTATTGHLQNAAPNQTVPGTPIAKYEGLTKNERLTFGVSLVALIVSLTGVYFQFFYVVDDLKASLADIRFADDGKGFVVHLAVANNGNRTGIVQDLEIWFDVDGKPTRYQPKFYADSKPPFLVQPGGVAILSFEISTGSAYAPFKKEATKASASILAKISTIDSKALRYYTDLELATLSRNAEAVGYRYQLDYNVKPQKAYNNLNPGNQYVVSRTE